jgi:hypothetical protein
MTGFDYDTCSKLDVLIDGKRLTVDPEFTTDLASIPKYLWPWLAPQDTRLVYPAILHDFLYRCPDGISRQWADEVFYSALVKEGVSGITSAKMYFAVRAFGASHFNNMDNCDYNFTWENHRYAWKPHNERNK